MKHSGPSIHPVSWRNPKLENGRRMGGDWNSFYHAHDKPRQRRTTTAVARKRAGPTTSPEPEGRRSAPPGIASRRTAPGRQVLLSAVAASAGASVISKTSDHLLPLLSSMSARSVPPLPGLKKNRKLGSWLIEMPVSAVITTLSL